MLAPDIIADPGDAELLSAAVREAGELALSFFRRGVRRWSKADGTPVSEGDIAVDELLKKRLRPARPSYGWLSEETPDDAARLAHERIWIVDPIDGTRDFVGGGKEWCIAAALIANGRPIAASVYSPVRDELFEAIAEEGARLNGRPLLLPRRDSLEGARLIGNKTALRQIARSANIISAADQNVPLALRLCGVAAGRFDAAVATTRKHDWDLASGDLIVHEAGGVVTGVAGDVYRYNRRDASQAGLIAAGPALHGPILEALGAM